MTNNKEISRRSFLKLMGAAGATAVGVASCDGKKDGTNAVEEIPTGQMTYRTNPSTGDKVSLLGFGMMRLPSVGGRSAREGKEEIDQEMVNQMVDYAIAHGVNYFDTSPAYCRVNQNRQRVLPSAVIRVTSILLLPSFRISRPLHGAGKPRWPCITTRLRS